MSAIRAITNASLTPVTSAGMTGYDHQPSAPETVCYRHPDRPSGISCQRCDRHICGSCRTQASIGSHCPECVKGNTQKVYHGTQSLPGNQGIVTMVIMGINLAIFVVQTLLERQSVTEVNIIRDFGLSTFYEGEWYRLLTSGFVHGGLIHVAMNMYSLWWLGRILERTLGPRSFALAYIASLLGGSFAVVMLTNDLVVGASGAIYGLGGLLVMLFRSRGISMAESGMLPLIAINLFINLQPRISVEGHGGGLVVGLVLAVLYFGLKPGDKPMFDRTKTDLVTVGIIAALLLGGVFFML